ncbi:hypothetical protein MKW94_030322 [Papaver nudicaule]|uniref:Ubiquitin-like protease family profile domain-containing protein n=1 Tax=Papaver nudicaule TaxID=74823 RepID=A0AA41VMF0_PAPNU|nr:hypothetical protein [Papaver nudicaule]
MKRKSSQKKEDDVYSFTEDDAKIEHDSKTNMKKYQHAFAISMRRPRKDVSPVTKYDFLNCFSRGSNDAQVGTSEAPIIEIDSSNSGHKSRRKSDSGNKQEIKSLYDSNNVGSRGSNYAQVGTSEASIVEDGPGNSGCKSKRKSKTVLLKSLYAGPTSREGSVTKERISGLDEMLVSDTNSSELHVLSSSDNDESGNIFCESPGISSCRVKDSSLAVPSSGKIHTISQDLPSDNDSPDVMLVDVKCGKQSSPRFCSSVIGEIEGCAEDSASDHNSSEWDRVNINTEVVVSPDLLKYEDKYGERNCSESSLTFSHSCIKLECTNLYGKREPFSSEWANSQVSSIECQWFSPVQTALVKICITPIAEKEVEDVNDDPGHLELKLAVSDPLWSNTQEKIHSLDSRYRALWKHVLDNDDTWECGFSRESGLSCLKDTSPNIDEHFDGVIYPQSDPDAVIITKRDIELLQPETFLNDTIIDFYIKYLKTRIPPEDGQRFHFFNSFFFRKLADLDKDLPSASQGRKGFQRVRKWTRKVNLFEKDYVFIPINFHHHWSLIILCHPGEVANSKGEDVENSVKVPCILHMNSIEGSHRGLMKVIQSYLLEEWNERTAGASEDFSSKFHNLRFVNLEVPQQENSYDCGLFLLHYVECFLQEAPVNFSPFNIAKDSNFLSVNWFVPAEASRKRSVIFNLINELAEDRRREHAPTADNDKHDLSVGNTENDSGEESGMPSVSEAGTSGRICHADSSFSIAGLRIEYELLESSAESFTEAESQTDSFQQLNGSELQENAEIDEQFPNAPPGELHKIALYNVGVSEELGEDENEGYNVETSSLGSRAGMKLGMELQHILTYNLLEQEETEKPRSSSAEDARCIVDSPTSAHERPEDRIVEDSEEVAVSPEDSRCMVGNPAPAHERPEDCIVVEDSEEVTVSPEFRCIVGSPAPAHERPEDRIVEDSEEVTVSPEFWCIVGSPAPAPAHVRLEDCIVEDSQEVNMVMAS